MTWDESAWTEDGFARTEDSHARTDDELAPPETASTPTDDGGKAARIAFVMREIEAMQNRDGSVSADLAQARRADNGPSRVYSLRLAPGEITALERRAAQLELKPSVLARNLLRVGLRAGARDDRIRPAVNHLLALLGETSGIEAAADELLALLG